MSRSPAFGPTRPMLLLGGNKFAKIFRAQVVAENMTNPHGGAAAGCSGAWSPCRSQFARRRHGEAPGPGTPPLQRDPHAPREARCTSRSRPAGASSSDAERELPCRNQFTTPRQTLSAAGNEGLDHDIVWSAAPTQAHALRHVDQLVTNAREPLSGRLLSKRTSTCAPAASR